MTIKDYSSTAASNTAINGVSIAGTAPVSNMDDGLRNVMADISNWTDSDTLVSGSTTDLGSVAGMYVTVSGTATITGFGTLKAGMVKFVYFSGAGQITHNDTSMILPGAANITRAAGDTAVFVSEGSGNWRCLDYSLGSGKNGNLFKVSYVTASGTFNFDPASRYYEVDVVGAGGAGGGTLAGVAGGAAAAPGGASGGFARKFTTVPTSKTGTVTIGSGGTGSTGAAGGSGGSSSWVTADHTMTATGGAGGGATGSFASGAISTPTDAGVGSGDGDTNQGGNPGAPGYAMGQLPTGSANIAYACGGTGGSGVYGGGGLGGYAATRSGVSGNANGSTALGFGGGGGGGAGVLTAGATAGGNGRQGIVIIREYK